VELEQEVASVIAAAQRIAGDIGYYYWNLPENFKCPAMFFPIPEITTGGDTFRSYASEYSWYIKVFSETTEQAHCIALAVLTALKEARNYVPLIDEEGRPTGKKLRLKDPSLKKIDDGIVELVIEWTSRRAYDGNEPLKVQTVNINIKPKED
jgi:hypothetical protein